MNMEKKLREQADESGHQLAAFLADIRAVRRMTLRQVEEGSQGQVSNAYLSQLENGHITKPSPHVLHALAGVYGVPYETLMEKAGYITVNKGRLASERHGRVATFADATLTPDEESELLRYLAFLRSRKGKK